MRISFLKEKSRFRRPTNSPAGFGRSSKDLDCDLVSEELFIRLLCTERKRSERSRKFLLLMLLDVEKVLGTQDHDNEVLQKIVSALSFSTRDRKSTRLNSSHGSISYAVFCLKKKK